MTKIINLYGGPGTGKSTSAAYMFAQLKNKGVNAELVREYVKDWAWEERQVGLFDQLYLMGKQVRKESMLLGKVDVIITDSPVWLAGYYASKYSPPVLAQGIEHAIRSYYSQSEIEGHEHHHVFLERTKKYDSRGRYQTEEQAKKIDKELSSFLSSRGIDLSSSGTGFDNLSITLRLMGLLK